MASRTLNTVFIAVLYLLSGTAAAEAAEKPEVKFGVFVDSYYAYNFNRPPQVSAALPPANNTYRYYDTYHNQMTLNLAEVSMGLKYKEVSLLADLDFGPFADLNATSNSVVDESSKHIGQAVVSFRPVDSRFFLEAGKMYSHMGLETVKSKDNFNYSRTIFFSYGMPFWHTGVRLGFDAIPEKLQTSLYVYNGWNTLYDTNSSKTLGLQVKYMPSSSLSMAYNLIGGPERMDTESDLKTVHEANITVVASQKWTVAGDLLYGSEEGASIGTNKKTAKWYGAILVVKYQLNDLSFLSPRYEVYRDEDGHTLAGPSQTIQSATFTYSRILTQGLEARAELRHDFSTEKTFTAASENKKFQTTALVALLFAY